METRKPTTPATAAWLALPSQAPRHRFQIFEAQSQGTQYESLADRSIANIRSIDAGLGDHEEALAILQGKAKPKSKGSAAALLAAGMLIYIPPRARHSVTNTGTGPLA